MVGLEQSAGLGLERVFGGLPARSSGASRAAVDAPLPRESLGTPLPSPSVRPSYISSTDGSHNRTVSTDGDEAESDDHSAPLDGDS